MTPVWLFDFLKKGSLESFFSTYHKALLQSDPQLNPKRWFYVTEGKDSNMSVSLVEEKLQHLLVDISEEKQKLIESWTKNDRVLNVIFTGDLLDPATHKHFMSAVNFLVENRPQATVRFYALLWRPSSSVIESGLPKESIDFITELDKMMAKNENYRFHKVLFFESSLLQDEKDKAFSSMALAALHIATHTSLGENDELSRSHRNVIYNAGAAGAFYEKAVQNEQETFYLSNLLLGTVAHGGDTFVDPVAATGFLNRHEVFFENFSPENIAAQIKDDCELVPSDRAAYSVDCEVSPFSLKFKAVWKKYYNDYIVNLKANLINKTKKTLAEFVQNYKETLFSAQLNFVNKVKDEIEAKVFEIFRNPDDHDALSIPQAHDILDKMRQRIDDMSKDSSSARISSFVFPKYLDGAREQVEAEVQNNDPSEVIARLESKLRKHPVYLLSVFVRAMVLGALLSYTGVTFLLGGMSELAIWGIGTLLFLLPFAFSIWNFHEYLVRINSLKDQYVAAVLLKYKKELDADLKKCVAKTYSDIDQFMEWLKVHKLNALQAKLAAVAPPEFSFMESSRFQPLMKCMPYGDSNEGRLIIPSTSVTAETDSSLSGSFGTNPILKNPPVSMVDVRGNQYSFNQIIQEKSQDLLRYLVRQMLKSTANVKGNVEQKICFEAIRTPRTKLLLLDVSGSMSDSDMAELKVAVERLSDTATIKWVAFNEKVVATGDSAEEFKKISSGGGTNYIPALAKAREIMTDCLIDQVILISDGQPFESISEILSEAYKLEQPVHTISIGNRGASVMKQISDMTSGEQIIVNDIKELSVDVESKFNVIFSLGLDGNYTFAEMMQKVYIPGCAEALHSFAKSHMVAGVTTIAELIELCADPQGMAEWAEVSDVSCTHSTAVAPREHETKNYIQMVCQSERDVEEVEKKFSTKFDHAAMSVISGVPEIVVSVLTVRPLSKITDLQWADYKGLNN